MKDNDISHPDVKDVGSLVKSSTKWVLVFLILRQLSTIIATAILSRIVSPHETGLFAMAAIMVSFVVLIDTGLTWATVQASNMNEKKINSLISLNVLVAISVYVFCAASGPILAWFFNEKALVGIMIFLGAAPAFNSLATQFSALLKRQLKNKDIGLIDLSSILIGSIFAVIFAFFGFGVWALVAQIVFMNFFRFVFSYSKYSRKIILKFDREGLDIFVQGMKLALSNYVCFFQLYMGQLLVGRFFGAESLGYYSKSLALRSIPLNYISIVATDIVVASIAVMATAHDDRNIFYMKSVRIVGFLGCGIMGLIYPVAAESVQILYGSQWLKTTKILEIMVFSGLLMPLTAAATWMYLGRGLAKEQLKMNIFNTSIAIAGYFCIVFLSDGLLDFVLYEMILMVFLAINSFYLASRYCKFSFGGFLYMSVVFVGAATSAALLSSCFFGNTNAGSVINFSILISKVLVYALFYISICVLLIPDLKNWLLGYLKK